MFLSEWECLATLSAVVENKVQAKREQSPAAESKALRVLATQDQYHASLAAVLASTSWHLNKPLRWRWIHSQNEETSCSGKGEGVSNVMPVRAIPGCQ